MTPQDHVPENQDRLDDTLLYGEDFAQESYGEGSAPDSYDDGRLPEDAATADYADFEYSQAEGLDEAEAAVTEKRPAAKPAGAQHLRTQDVPQDEDPLPGYVPAQQPVDQTQLFPLPAPRYDEERGGGMEDAYEQGFSRIGTAYNNPRKAREIPIPHIGDEDGTGYRIPGEGKSRGRLRPLLAFFLVAAMAAGIYAAATYGLGTWGGQTVPDVTGISETRARAALEDAGFQVESKSRIADDGIGIVLEQDPPNGERLDEGSTVTIVVATSRLMPEVVGLWQDEALDLLSKAGAENVEVVGSNSEQEEGTVLAVQPGVGEGFSARQTITLTVAQKPQVPDVLGKEKVEAQAAIEAEGFWVELHYIRSDAAPNTVAYTDPEAGTKVDPGTTVHLYISEAVPSSPLHLLEYFGKSSPNIAGYLSDQGFWLSSSFLSSESEAEAVYQSDTYGTLCFCNRPYSHSYMYSKNTGEDVLNDGHPFVGIRWEVPASMVPVDADKMGETPIRELMNLCGFSGVTDTCTNADITVPSGTQKTKAKFRCTYGEAGSTCWTILIVNEGENATRVVVTCAPISYYQTNYDLSQYGDSICDMVACSDVYTEL